VARETRAASFRRLLTSILRFQSLRVISVIKEADPMRTFLSALTLSVAILGAPVWVAAQDDKTAAIKTVSTVNLNTATAEQLETLPGIGRRTAERILEHRQKSGGFKKIEELMNVRGIGEKSFLKLKPMITVTPVAEKPAR